MKLTEREKWLMQQAWNASKDYNNESNTIADWMEPGLNNIDTEMLLAHDAPASESIVKQVDPDNLPKGEVWAWCEDGLYLGGILFHKTFDGLVIDNCFETLSDPTHYIEQKDLIKLFEDSK